MTHSLEVFEPDELWLRSYVVSVGGARINARMTVIKLRSGDLLIHSPCAFDEALTAQVASLGPVAAIIAPGNFHVLVAPAGDKSRGKKRLHYITPYGVI